MLVVESNGLFIAFIHIPKTAGTTLREILKAALKIYFINVEVNKIKAYPSPSSPRRRAAKNSSLSSKNTVIVDNRTEQTVGDTPKVVCYGYWNVSDGIDLAHVPRRFFQEYYPPNSGLIAGTGCHPARWCSPRISETMKQPTETHQVPPKMDKSKFTWITCVRNPYARIYSAYCWHNKENHLLSTPEGFKFFVALKLTKIVEEYESLFKQNRPPSPEYIHFIPMWMMVSDKDGIPRVDHIIRQEEFDQQVSSLLKKLGLPVPKEYANAHCRKQTPPPPYDYLKHYDPDTIKIVEKLYRRDFELFGYRILGKSGLDSI